MLNWYLFHIIVNKRAIIFLSCHSLLSSGLSQLSMSVLGFSGSTVSWLNTSNTHSVSHIDVRWYRSFISCKFGYISLSTWHRSGVSRVLNSILMLHHSTCSAEVSIEHTTLTKAYLESYSLPDTNSVSISTHGRYLGNSWISNQHETFVLLW